MCKRWYSNCRYRSAAGCLDDVRFVVTRDLWPLELCGSVDLCWSVWSLEDDLDPDRSMSHVRPERWAVQSERLSVRQQQQSARNGSDYSNMVRNGRKVKEGAACRHFESSDVVVRKRQGSHDPVYAGRNRPS
jgi:hypothetical protein